jgi:hypothetical protein
VFAAFCVACVIAITLSPMYLHPAVPFDRPAVWLEFDDANCSNMNNQDLVINGECVFALVRDLNVASKYATAPIHGFVSDSEPWSGTTMYCLRLAQGAPLSSGFGDKKLNGSAHSVGNFDTSDCYCHCRCIIWPMANW